VSWSCKCGRSAKDQTDYLSFKGHVIADQDWERLVFEWPRLNLEEYETAKSDPSALAAWARRVLGRELQALEVRRTLQEQFVVFQSVLWSRYSRLVYQCPACARVYLLDAQGQIYAFVPEEPGTPSELLVSPDREQWAKVLVASWPHEPPLARGWVEVHWRWARAPQIGNRRIETPAYRALFDSSDEIERHYFELFERLRPTGELLSAELWLEGTVRHRWTAEDDATGQAGG
jgi:hypothetical protein